MSRSDSSRAFDNYFNPQANVNDIFEDLFAPAVGSPDFEMSVKSETNFIDDFLSSISESPPNSPSSDVTFEPTPMHYEQPMVIQQQQTSFAPMTPMSPPTPQTPMTPMSPPTAAPMSPMPNALESYIDVQPVHSISQDQPVSELKMENTNLTVPANLTISELLSITKADQIVVPNGDNEKIVYILDTPPGTPQQMTFTEDSPMQNVPVKHELMGLSPLPSPRANTKGRGKKVSSASPDKKVKLEQNRKASKRYREKKRSKEAELFEDIKILESRKHACEIEVAKIKSHNECLADQIKRKFAHLL